jgi:hypothetical protein
LIDLAVKESVFSKVGRPINWRRWRREEVDRILGDNV